MFALLNREPFAGITWREFRRTPDVVIVHGYLAEFDKDFRLVPLRERWRRDHEGGLTGSPDRAGQELPPVADLRIPPECFGVGVPMSYVSVFFQHFRRVQQWDREFTDEMVMAKWQEVLRTYRPRNAG